jgi:hypothetical protein
MATHLAHVVIDARDPKGLARFWADALAWQVLTDEPDEVEIHGGADDINLIFVPVAETNDAKSRVHLDLTTGPSEDQAAKVAGLIERGARRVDIGQGDTRWTVLADPEGNEFCVLPPNYYESGTGPVGAICITPEHPDALAKFWAAATGWPHTARGLHRGRGPHIVFGGGTPKAKTAKNRVRIDIAPPVGEQPQAEAGRLIGLGAKTVNVGQRDVPWIVMSDPEGNEFCILTPR